MWKEEVRLLSKGNQLPHHSKLHHLDGFIDSDGMLRIGGRLGHSSPPLTCKHSAVIPREFRF